MSNMQSERKRTLVTQDRMLANSGHLFGFNSLFFMHKLSTTLLKNAIECTTIFSQFEFFLLFVLSFFHSLLAINLSLRSQFWFPVMCAVNAFVSCFRVLQFFALSFSFFHSCFQLKERLSQRKAISLLALIEFLFGTGTNQLGCQHSAHTQCTQICYCPSN